jgi:hypothetical protein
VRQIWLAQPSQGLASKPSPRPSGQDADTRGTAALEKRQTADQERQGRQYDANRKVADAVAQSGKLGLFISELVLGFTPVGVALDTKDLSEASTNLRNYPSWKNAIFFGLAMVAFAPLVGDAAKGLSKLGDDVIEAGSDLARQADNTTTNVPEASATNPTGTGARVAPPRTNATVGGVPVVGPPTLAEAPVRSLKGRQGPQEFNQNNIKRIKKSITERGFARNQPIDIAEVDDVRIVLDGHHRARAAGAATPGGVKMRDVPVRIWEVTKEVGAKLLAQAAEAAERLGLPW